MARGLLDWLRNWRF